MKWDDRVQAEEEKVRKNRILEGPNKTNCWWLKKGKKKRKTTRPKYKKKR